MYFIIVSTCVGNNELLNIVSKGCKSNNFTCMSQKLLKLEEYCCCRLHIPFIIKSKRLYWCHKICKDFITLKLNKK